MGNRQSLSWLHVSELQLCAHEDNSGGGEKYFLERFCLYKDLTTAWYWQYQAVAFFEYKLFVRLAHLIFDRFRLFFNYSSEVLEIGRRDILILGAYGHIQHAGTAVNVFVWIQHRRSRQSYMQFLYPKTFKCIL